MRYLSNNVQRDEQDGDAGNLIDAGAGQDAVFAGTGSDIVHAGDDADDVYGMAGNDVLYGDAGNDRLYGDGPSQYDPSLVIYAAAAQHGAHIIDGGAGNDLLIGQGNDTLYGDDRDNANTPADVDGRDYLDGGDVLRAPEASRLAGRASHAAVDDGAAMNDAIFLARPAA